MGIIKALFKTVDFILSRSYRVVVGTLTILWMIGVLLNPILTVILSGIWTLSVAIITFSWKKTKGTAKWTLKTLWQQFKDWREGRRRRKAEARRKIYGE